MIPVKKVQSTLHLLLDSRSLDQHMVGRKINHYLLFYLFSCCRKLQREIRTIKPWECHLCMSLVLHTTMRRANNPELNNRKPNNALAVFVCFTIQTLFCVVQRSWLLPSLHELNFLYFLHRYVCSKYTKRIN